MSERKRRRLREPRDRARQDIVNGAPARVLRAVSSDAFDVELASFWARFWRAKRRRRHRRLDDEERAIVRAAARNWPGPWQPLLQLVYDANDVELSVDLCAQHDIAPHLFLRAAFAGRSAYDQMDNGVRPAFFGALARDAPRRTASMLALDPLRCDEFKGRTPGLVGAWWDLTMGADAARGVPQHVYNDIAKLFRCPFGAHELRVLVRHWHARIRCATKQTVGERVAEQLRARPGHGGDALRRLWLETLYALAPLALPVHVLDALVRRTFPAPFAPLLALYCPPTATVRCAQAARDFFCA